MTDSTESVLCTGEEIFDTLRTFAVEHPPEFLRWLPCPFDRARGTDFREWVGEILYAARGESFGYMIGVDTDLKQIVCLRKRPPFAPNHPVIFSFHYTFVEKIAQVIAAPLETFLPANRSAVS